MQRAYSDLTMLCSAVVLTMIGAACNAPLASPAALAATPVPTVTQAPATPVSASPLPPTAVPPSATAGSAPTHVPIQAAEPQEAVLILEPGPGSRATSPLHVAGIADPTFEQALVVRLVLDDGSLLALEPVQIQSELGTRGPFEVEVPFTLTEERAALLQVYSTSARDGGTTHLSSVGLRLAPGAPADIRAASAGPERLQIHQPVLLDRISGGVAHVAGFGLASFEGTLLVQVYDVDGNQVGSVPIIVQSPDIGQPGSFAADVPYSVASEGPGRIVVVDPLPAFDGVGHIASVEITLAP